MASADRGAVESEQSATLEDAVDDGECEIVIVQHTSPGGERLVRGKDHGALAPVAVVDDVKEHVGSVHTVGEVADFVNDEDVGMRAGGQGCGERAVAEPAESSSMSSAAVTKRASKPFWIAR